MTLDEVDNPEAAVVRRVTSWCISLSQTREPATLIGAGPYMGDTGHESALGRGLGVCSKGIFTSRHYSCWAPFGMAHHDRPTRNPRQTPATPPIIDSPIADSENMPAPHMDGIILPMLDPMKRPAHTNFLVILGGSHGGHPVSNSMACTTNDWPMRLLDESPRYRFFV